MSTDEEKETARLKMQAWRAKRKAAGIKDKPKTPDQLRRQAEAQNRFRERRRLQGEIPSPWARDNAERHRENVAKWRAANPEKAREMSNRYARELHATPWGSINQKIWGALRPTIRSNSHAIGRYHAAIGYSGADLRAHIEAQFTPEMNWDNWPEYWEIDHIKPLSAYRYESLIDPLVREAWALSNIRPLHWRDNRGKGGTNVKYK